MAARIVGKLNARQVTNAKPPNGKQWAVIPDGGNLYLQATRGKQGHISRSWLFKYEIAGKRHELGLGPTHTIGLAKAREKARELREQLLDGLDPLTERRKQQQVSLAEKAKSVTFKQVAEMYLGLHLDSFKNPKHRAQWRSTLATYVYPKIGRMTVAEVGPADVLRVVEPIWNTKRETASRVRQRVERILDYASTRGFRSGDNPAAHVTESLPKGGNGKGHHAALHYAELPTFMAELGARDSVSARALEFTILTAARTAETIRADADEFDLEAQVWTVPADRMKARKEHRVPLCARAVEILQSLPRHGTRPFTLSNMAMAELLKGMRPGVTVHGFRSSFRDWAAEMTNYANHVVEQALAHTIGDKVEAAYRRGDLFVKRRKLMDDWARYCSKPAAAAAGSNVVAIGDRTRL
jgi:integrase